MPRINKKPDEKDDAREPANDRDLETQTSSRALIRAELKALKAERDETAFLPAALEILESPPSPLGRWILWLVMGFAAIALLWASLSSVDIVAAAPGKITPRDRVKVIQAADLGVVRAIHIVDGQRVKAGQPLVELDPTTSAAEAAQAREALLSARMDEARALALVDYALGKRDAKFIAPAGADPSAVITQERFVAARIAEQETSLAGLRQERIQRHNDTAMVLAETKKLQEQLPLITRQLESMRALEAKGYAARLRGDEVEERAIGMRQDLAIRTAELAKDKAALAGVTEQINKLESEFKRESLNALTEAQATRALREEELKKAEEKKALTILRAPEDGIVAQLSVHTLSGVVKPADPILVIVPQGAELIVEAQVLNKDIGFVREGQNAEVKLEAFPFTRYGVLHATLEHISRDAVQDEKLGLVFPCRLKLKRNVHAIHADGKIVALQPGMAVTAEIKTGDRRVIDFLLSPLARRVGEAGRER